MPDQDGFAAGIHGDVGLRVRAENPSPRLKIAEKF
jgi:hypothetical protein